MRKCDVLRRESKRCLFKETDSSFFQLLTFFFFSDSPSSARSTPAAAAPSPYYMSSPAIAAAANPPLSAGGKMYSEPEEMAPTGQMAMFQPSAPPPIQRKSIDSDESILYDDSNVDNASNASYVSYGYVPSPYAGQQQRF